MHRTDLSRYLERLVPAASEAAYDRLAGYGFARRYVEGKVVANIGWQDAGYGSRLLTETAESVVGVASSTEAVDLASAAYPHPNVRYTEAELPELPYPEGYFDVVVALEMTENVERPEDLVREARRVLKRGGVLVVSAPDRSVRADEGRGMHLPELRQMLERHFERVHLYRHGSVVGGFVSPLSGGMNGASVESASLSLTDPHVGAEVPTARSVLAVCGGTGVLGREEHAYLLLDRDRRVFDECEDLTEDVELLRDEIQRMQDIEVQAFQDSFKLHSTELAHLRAQLRRAKAQLRAMENSTTWRLFEPYRRLRSGLHLVKNRFGVAKGSSGTRPG